MNLIIQYDPAIDIEALIANTGGTIIKKYSLPGFHQVLAEIPDTHIASLQAEIGIMNISLSTPDDVSTQEVRQGVRLKDYRESWGADQIGVPQVHAAGNTGQGIRLAILDTGIAEHPDLRIAGGINARADEVGQPFTDRHSHGTHCSGIATAQANTGEGVTGVAPDALLHGVKVLSDSGSGSWGDILTGLEWCIQNNIQVISLSLGGSRDPGEPVHNGFIAAHNAGIVIVAAAGNSGQGSPDTTMYPAKWDEVICVTATADRANNLASYSSHGPPAEVAAPGSDIRSTVLDGQYGLKSGTSMACPHVAGVFCLSLKAGVQDPRKLLETASKELGAPGRDPSFGWGLIDAPGMTNGSDLPVHGRHVQCDTSASFDPDGEIVNRQWKWGDGHSNISSDPVMTHQYAEDGIYALTVILLDDEGAQAQETLEMEVRSTTQNQPPVVRFTVTDI